MHKADRIASTWGAIVFFLMCLLALGNDNLPSEHFHWWAVCKVTFWLTAPVWVVLRLALAR